MPFSQPRNILGGHFFSSLIGLICQTLFGATWWSVAIAVGTAISVMMLTRTTHPPAGSNPVIIYLTKPAWGFLLFPTVFGTSENRGLTYAQLRQAIDYIHTHLYQDLSLVQIAKVINISPTYFASLFKRATGFSPHQYVIKQRVERAEMLLKKTDLTIALHCIASGVFQSKPSHSTV